MDNDENSLGLALHYLQIDQPQRALDTLDRAQTLVDASEYWRLRAAALVDLDEAGEAVNAAARGLQIEPDDLGLLIVHALAQIGVGDLAAAERSLLAALRIDPENATLLAQYAILVARAGQLDKAARLLNEAERVDPLNDEAVTARGFLAYLSGDDAAAVRHAEDLLAENPEAAAGHLLRGAVLVERGSARAARRHLDAAARMDPANTNIVNAARQTRWATHPLMWPLIPIHRFGAMKVWFAYLVLVGLAVLTHVTAIIAVVVVSYVLLVAYSWVVPPILRAWLRRRSR